MREKLAKPASNLNTLEVRAGDVVLLPAAVVATSRDDVSVRLLGLDPLEVEPVDLRWCYVRSVDRRGLRPDDEVTWDGAEDANRGVVLSLSEHNGVEAAWVRRVDGEYETLLAVDLTRVVS